MTIKDFAGFVIERANAGDTVYPSGAALQGVEPFSAQAWKGANDYADTLKKKSVKHSSIRPSKTPNIR